MFRNKWRDGRSNRIDVAYWSQRRHLNATVGASASEEITPPSFVRRSLQLLVHKDSPARPLLSQLSSTVVRAHGLAKKLELALARDKPEASELFKIAKDYLRAQGLPLSSVMPPGFSIFSADGNDILSIFTFIAMSMKNALVSSNSKVGLRMESSLWTTAGAVCLSSRERVETDAVPGNTGVRLGLVSSRWRAGVNRVVVAGAWRA